MYVVYINKVFFFLFLTFYFILEYSWLVEASLVAQKVKNLPAMQDSWIWSLGGEDPMEKRMATLVFLPGEFHGQRSLESYSPWGHKKLDTTEQLSLDKT